MKTNFDEHFSVHSKITKHINVLLESDLELFIDPYKIANNLDKRIAKKLYLRSKAFLEVLNQTYIVTNDRINGLKFLSHLKEANEYGFGYSKRKKGKGIGKTKAEIIFESLSNNKFAKQGISITNEAHNVLLLVKGIGQDNMSDTLANVCRDIFAEFTNQECLKYNIPVYPATIEFYDAVTESWLYKKVDLPIYKGKHIILVPKFLTNGGRIYSNYYNWFISSNYISKDILEGKIKIGDPSKFINQLKNGDKKAIIKNINKQFRKPKQDLIDFVKHYQDSLIKFQLHIKENFPDLTDDEITALLN